VYKLKLADLKTCATAPERDALLSAHTPPQELAASRQPIQKEQ
jgi:hypothetical protein